MTSARTDGLIEEIARRQHGIVSRAQLLAAGVGARAIARRERRQAIGHAAWVVGFEHDRLVTTVVFSDQQFERGPMSAHPLVKSILREGLAA